MPKTKSVLATATAFMVVARIAFSSAQSQEASGSLAAQPKPQASAPMPIATASAATSVSAAEKNPLTGMVSDANLLDEASRYGAIPTPNDSFLFGSGRSWSSNSSLVGFNLATTDSMARIVAQLLSMARAPIEVPASILQIRPHINFRAEFVPEPELLSLLLAAMKKDAGVVFDTRADGSWLARLQPGGYLRPTEPTFVVATSAEKYPKDPIYQKQSRGVVDDLIRRFTGKSDIAGDEQTNLGRQWAPPLVDRVEVSSAVWKVETAVTIVALGSPAEVRTQIAEQLRKQTGIVTEILPNRTLRLRLENADNDPVVSSQDFKAAPIADVIKFLSSISGRSYRFPTTIPRVIQPPPQPQRGGRGSAPSPQGMGSAAVVVSGPQELAGRSLTLHVDGGPTSQVLARVLTALETQAEIVAEETTSPRTVNLRLTTDAAAKMRYSMDVIDADELQIVNCLRTLTGLSIKSIAGQPGGGRRGAAGAIQVTRTSSFSIINATRAEVAQRLIAVLKDDFDTTLEEQPDGSFIVRHANQP